MEVCMWCRGSNPFIDTLLSIASLYMACMYCMYSL